MAVRNSRTMSVIGVLAMMVILVGVFVGGIVLGGRVNSRRPPMTSPMTSSMTSSMTSPMTSSPMGPGMPQGMGPPMPTLGTGAPFGAGLPLPPSYQGPPTFGRAPPHQAPWFGIWTPYGPTLPYPERWWYGGDSLNPLWHQGRRYKGCGGCNKNYSPVCGEDGKTYRNSCCADNVGVDIAYPGKCDPEEDV